MKEKFDLDKRFNYCILKNKNNNKVSELIKQFNSNQIKCEFLKYKTIKPKTIIAFCTKINKSCKYSNCPKNDKYAK